MTQIAHSFDPGTGQYLGPVQMQPSPRQPGDFLQPANTLLEAPPETGANEVACAIDGEWVLKPDYRGTYYLPDRSAVEIDEIGVEPDPEWTVEPAPKTLVEIKADLVTGIDNDVAGIYNRFTRFESEYTLREAQAQAFKDAGYTGPVPEQVGAFATPAGMSAEAATDLILSQAANLRAALGLLGVKRMRKYEIINAADATSAQAKFDEISAEINAIGDSLS